MGLLSFSIDVTLDRAEDVGVLIHDWSDHGLSGVGLVQDHPDDLRTHGAAGLRALSLVDVLRT